MKICLAQMKPRLGDVEANISIIEQFTEKALFSSCDIIVFPELATSGYILRDLVGRTSRSNQSPEFSRIIELSRNIDIVLGYAQIEEGYFYNSAMYVSGGEIVHNHKKVYLPDYGMFEEQRYFSPGSNITVFKTGLGKTSVVICEDMFHLSTHHELLKQGAEVVFILSASPFWMNRDSIKPNIWKETAKCYSRLSCSYTVFTNRVGFEDGVNFFGNSFIVNPHGNIIAEAPMFEEHTLICEVDKREIFLAREKFPVAKNEVTCDNE